MVYTMGWLYLPSVHVSWDMQIEGQKAGTSDEQTAGKYVLATK